MRRILVLFAKAWKICIQVIVWFSIFFFKITLNTYCNFEKNHNLKPVLTIEFLIIMFLVNIFFRYMKIFSLILARIITIPRFIWTIEFLIVIVLVNLFYSFFFFQMYTLLKMSSLLYGLLRMKLPLWCLCLRWSWLGYLLQFKEKNFFFSFDSVNMKIAVE